MNWKVNGVAIKYSLVFCINAKSLTISFPDQSRAGVTVLFDQLFDQFGGNSLRLNTLQQVRGAREHFESTNTMWSYFTSPTDSLLGCGDEANIWVIGSNPEFRTAFWESTKVVRTIRGYGDKWDQLFSGSIARLLHPEQ